MEKKYGMQLMTREEFAEWIQGQHFYRYINMIHNHHTYIPDYSHFNGKNHLYRLNRMKIFHVNHNGWSDIAQNIGTFPDGKIAVCRNFEKAPASIAGHNARALCIEHFGNFDKGQDKMSEEHKKTIVFLNAILCLKFNIQPNVENIVYHHWYDLFTARRTNGSGATKSCPGNDFFGGNTVEAANKNFIPLIQKELKEQGGDLIDSLKTNGIKKHGWITATRLNVRNGASGKHKRVKLLPGGALVSIYDKKDGWYKIAKDEQWVFDNFVKEVFFGTITANSLNVRTGAANHYRALHTLPKDYKVTIYEKKGDWYKIDFNEKWVSASHVKLLEYGKITATALNVRTGAGNENEAIGVLLKNDEIAIYAKENDWYKIDLSGKWISSKFVDLV